MRTALGGSGLSFFNSGHKSQGAGVVPSGYRFLVNIRNPSPLDRPLRMFDSRREKDSHKTLVCQEEYNPVNPVTQISN